MPADLELPAGFRFGVATAGFQVEGGYNGPGQPANNWSAWEAAGRVEPSGVAVDFWNDYEHHLDRAVAAGCDSFRLSVEWARCEPREGELDPTAFERYRAILAACAERGLEPLVTLHHFTHPAWLGPDFWVDLDSPVRFASWAATAVAELGAGCRRWVTVNEPNVVALHTYVTGMFPPGRRMATGFLVRALDHLLAGHVLGYAAVKSVQPDARVATNTYSFTTYELDRLLIDVLVARRLGVARADLHPWLAGRRAAYHTAVGGPQREGLVRRLVASVVPLEQALPRAVGAVYESPFACTLDTAQIDYYDRVTARHIRAPGHRTAGGRNWLPARMLWDDPPDPRGLASDARLAAAATGLPVEVVENGLCNRVHDGTSHPRADGWNRVRYLRENLAALAGAIRAGVPVQGYWHWSLVDNYEWGSYQPRFGLYGIDRSSGRPVWSDRDSMGDDAASAYRELIAAMRAGEGVAS